MKISTEVWRWVLTGQWSMRAACVEYGVAWRCVDSRSLASVIGLGDETSSHSSISKMHKRFSSEVFDEWRRASSCFVEPPVVPLVSAESRAGSVLRRSDQRPRQAFT